MDSFDNWARRWYYVDQNGRRVLVGPTMEDSFEFETIEDPAARNDSGADVARACIGCDPPQQALARALPETRRSVESVDETCSGARR